MLSEAVTDLFTCAGARFGVDIEILDGALKRSFPDAETEFDRAVREQPPVRQTLMDCIASGRAARVVVDGETYDALPLQRDAGRQRGLALAVVRSVAPPTAGVPEFWVDFVRATITADVANGAAMSAERHRARRLLGTLRFLGQLVQTDSEADLAHALIQAAAVWFDADARVYQRDLSGDLALYAALPGTVINGAARRLSSEAGVEGIQRTSSSALWGDETDSDVVLVPLDTGEEPASVLTLIGARLDEMAQLPILGAIAGAQIGLCRARRRDRVRHRFLDQLQDGPEAVVVQLVRNLVSVISAGGAVLTVESDGHSRNVVALGRAPNGAPAARTPAAASVFDPTAFSCEFPLADNARAVLTLHAADGTTFSTDDAMVTRVAGQILDGCLRALGPALAGASMALASAEAPGAFLQRIEQELDRAKRFDLHLALVLIDMPAQLPSEDSVRLQDMLRAHLRGSDVLGSVGLNRMAAVLTHTGGPGSHRVVERLRRRLAESTARLGIAGVIIGHAEFSPEFRTADALVLAAARDAIPVASMS